jgi:hypothetical protein
MESWIVRRLAVGSIVWLDRSCDHLELCPSIIATLNALGTKLPLKRE